MLLSFMSESRRLMLERIVTAAGKIERRTFAVNVRNAKVPPPPANVPGLVEKGPQGKPKSMRDAMVSHRANPVCASCHLTRKTC